MNKYLHIYFTLNNYFTDENNLFLIDMTRYVYINKVIWFDFIKAFPLYHISIFKRGDAFKDKTKNNKKPYIWFDISQSQQTTKKKFLLFTAYLVSSKILMQLTN